MQRSAWRAHLAARQRLDELEPVLHPLGDRPVGPVAALDLEEAGRAWSSPPPPPAPAQRAAIFDRHHHHEARRAPPAQSARISAARPAAGQSRWRSIRAAQPVRIVDRLQRDAGRVALRLEPAVRILDIGDAARHAGGEIAADRRRARRPRPPVIYSQPWSPVPSTTATAPELRTAKRSPATPAKKASPRGRAVEAGIADDDVRRRVARRAVGLADDQPAAGQALAGIIVGVADQLQRHAARRGRRRSSARPMPVSTRGAGCRRAGPSWP